MSAVTGIGTTFNLPNYHGELFALTPYDTPLLSAAGGISGGGAISGTTAEWQTYDLRDAAIRTRLEGADAPTTEERVRANVTNRTQIFHEAVATSPGEKRMQHGQRRGSALFVQRLDLEGLVSHRWFLGLEGTQFARSMAAQAPVQA